jgi:hypothetical protein
MLSCRSTASQLRQQLRELVEKQQQEQQQATISNAAVLPAAALGDLQSLLSAVVQVRHGRRLSDTAFSSANHPAIHGPHAASQSISCW